MTTTVTITTFGIVLASLIGAIVASAFLCAKLYEHLEDKARIRRHSEQQAAFKLREDERLAIERERENLLKNPPQAGFMEYVPNNPADKFAEETRK